MRLRLVAELLDAVHALDGRVLVLDDRLGLLLEHRRRRALDAGVVDDEVRLELVDDLVAQREALDLDGAVGLERQRADAAERRDVLVLLADRLLEEIDLELAGLARELLGRDELALERVQAVEQGDREAARRAETRVGGHVGQAVELEAAGDPGHAERRLEDAVPDLVDRVDDLALGVREADGVLEAARDADEDELVDGRGDDEAAVLARVAGEVGAASPEGEAHGGARYDHDAGLFRRCRSSSASPSGEPISKNLSCATEARKRFRAARSRCRASSPARLAGGQAAMTSRRSAVAP